MIDFGEDERCERGGLGGGRGGVFSEDGGIMCDAGAGKLLVGQGEGGVEGED